MAKNKSKFQAPIPGMGLTAEPKGRPWLNPPQYSTVEEVVGYYMPMFDREEFHVLLAEQLENGIPATTVTNILVAASVMEGKHTIDVGILVAPVLIEAMITVAENLGVDYKVGNEIDGSAEEDESLELIRRAVKNAKKKRGERVDEEVVQPPMEEMPEEEMMPQDAPPTGLMAPRGEMQNG